MPEVEQPPSVDVDLSLSGFVKLLRVRRVPSYKVCHLLTVTAPVMLPLRLGSSCSFSTDRIGSPLEAVGVGRVGWRRGVGDGQVDGGVFILNRLRLTFAAHRPAPRPRTSSTCRTDVSLPTAPLA